MEQAGLRQQSLASTPATAVQKRVALIFSGTLVCVVLSALPFARQVPFHAPVFNILSSAFASFANLITAYLLFGQFLRTRRPFLAQLAATYLFSSLIILPYVLTFPSFLWPHSWPHVGAQTSSWLNIFLRIGFPLGIFCSMRLELCGH